MKINIAGGRGLMGRIHQPIFENAGHKVTVSGRYSSPNMEEAAQQSDLTIVSVPIDATEDVIKRVAPYCTAIMDFTSLKTFPINTMLENSSISCEVGGLHPLYGEVKSIKGSTIVYCETKRSGKKCQTIVETLELAGAKIKIMGPETHDSIVNGIIQNARTELLETFALMLESSGFSIQELYSISPEPTRILIDLIARQVNEKNDEMYIAMKKYNPSMRHIEENLLNTLENILTIDQEKNRKAIRRFFGDQLKVSQERAKKLIEER